MTDKQCRPWSDATMRCLIWVYSVCSGMSVQILRVVTVPLRRCLEFLGDSEDFSMLKRRKTPNYHVANLYLWWLAGLSDCWPGYLSWLDHPRHPTDIDWLAYSWSTSAILEAGKGRGNVFISSFSSFIHFPLSSLSLSFISSTIFSISPVRLPFSGRQHKMTYKGWRR